MPAFDLTTTAAVKSWQGLTTADSDAAIAGIVSASSRAILGFLGRPIILPKVYTDRYDLRPGMRRTILRNWPVVSVASVQVGGNALQSVDPQSGGSRSGYGYIADVDPWGGAPPGAAGGITFLDDPSTLAAYRPQAIQVTYTAGYQDTDTFEIPAGGGAQAATPFYGNWASDMGAVYADTGAALTKVSGSPGEGQYAVSAVGTYVFSAADAGRSVTAAFGYVPSDLVQACTELAAQRFVSGSSVGVNSKSLGGQETVSYDRSALPETVLKLAQPYRRVVAP